MCFLSKNQHVTPRPSHGYNLVYLHPIHLHPFDGFQSSFGHLIPKKFDNRTGSIAPALWRLLGASITEATRIINWRALVEPLPSRRDPSQDLLSDSSAEQCIPL